jgi:exosortase family protein XrtM
MKAKDTLHRTSKPNPVIGSDSDKHWIGSGHEWLQFILFASCYLLLDYIYYFKIPVDLFINVLYPDGVVKVCADLINIIAPMEKVTSQLNHLVSVHADLEIVHGCDGANVLFLVVSAILVFPTGLNRKLIGLLLGVGLIYTLNLLRISTLYFVIAYYPDWFQLIHTYVAPTLMVLAGCCYFAWWAFASTKNVHEPA